MVQRVLPASGDRITACFGLFVTVYLLISYFSLYFGVEWQPSVGLEVKYSWHLISVDDFSAFASRTNFHSSLIFGIIAASFVVISVELLERLRRKGIAYSIKLIGMLPGTKLEPSQVSIIRVAGDEALYAIGGANIIGKIISSEWFQVFGSVYALAKLVGLAILFVAFPLVIVAFALLWITERGAWHVKVSGLIYLIFMEK